MFIGCLVNQTRGDWHSNLCTHRRHCKPIGKGWIGRYVSDVGTSPVSLNQT